VTGGEQLGGVDAEESVAVLRNPSGHEPSIRLGLKDALELPAGAAKVYSARSSWKEDAGRPAIVLQAQEAQAFQVLTLDILPGEAVDRRESAERRDGANR